MRYDEVLKERVKRLRSDKADRDAGKVSLAGIPTGLRQFDKTGGIDRSMLTVIGGPTGEGKSILRQHLQDSAAMAGLRALDLSFEDPPEKSADRTFAKLTGMNSDHFGKLTDSEIDRVRDAYRESKDWASRIEYHFGLRSPDECLEIIRASDADLVQVDYAQAFSEGSSGLERVISDFAWQLGVDAQKRNRAVILYSQIRSEVEHRGMRILESSKRKGADRLDVSGFRPSGVGDLAWSNALGQRAKVLIFLFRPGRWKNRFGEADPDNRIELNWTKRNFGSEGRTVIGFDKESARLYDLDKSA